jgi:hypothetical protein
LAFSSVPGLLRPHWASAYDIESFSGTIVDVIAERKGNIQDLDRTFDTEFWQAQGDAAIFDAAWDMIVAYYVHELGIPPEQIRLQRSVEHTGRRRGPAPRRMRAVQ